MSDLRITLACDLNDRTQAIANGRATPEGINLNFLPLQIEETFWRMLKHQEFDAAEMSMSSYMMTRDRGNVDLIAIPVFPSRYFRHSCIFINSNAGISGPEDLQGKNVGVPEYQMTASLWIRGILEDDYGIAPTDMQWYHGGEEEGGREEKLDLNPPEGLEIEYIPSDRTLSGMLADGDLDALVTARAPSSFETDAVERLFPDFQEVEQDYYERTGIFPIMHTVVLKQDVYEENRWIAQELYKSFLHAKKVCLKEISDSGALRVALPWLHSELKETRDVMGWDYWPYGIEDNRTTLETMVRYSYEQGLISQQFEVEELFAEETYDQYKV